MVNRRNSKISENNTADYMLNKNLIISKNLIYALRDGFNIGEQLKELIFGANKFNYAGLDV